VTLTIYIVICVVRHQASIGCSEESCRRSFHYRCADRALCFFDRQQYRLFCSTHYLQRLAEHLPTLQVKDLTLEEVLAEHMDPPVVGAAAAGGSRAAKRGRPSARPSSSGNSSSASGRKRLRKLADSSPAAMEADAPAKVGDTEQAVAVDSQPDGLTETMVLDESRLKGESDATADVGSSRASAVLVDDEAAGTEPAVISTAAAAAVPLTDIQRREAHEEELLQRRKANFEYLSRLERPHEALRWKPAAELWDELMMVGDTVSRRGPSAL